MVVHVASPPLFLISPFSFPHLSPNAHPSLCKLQHGHWRSPNSVSLIPPSSSRSHPATLLPSPSWPLSLSLSLNHPRPQIEVPFQVIEIEIVEINWGMGCCSKRINREGLLLPSVGSNSWMGKVLSVFFLPPPISLFNDQLLK